MSQKYDLLLNPLKILSEPQTVPGRSGSRKYRKSVRFISNYFKHLDEVESESAYNFLIGAIAEHFRQGGDFSNGYKKLADQLVAQVYAKRLLDLIRNHFFWSEEIGDYSAAKAKTIFIMAFFRHVGETSERSVSFCKLILDDYAKYEERFVKSGRSDEELNIFDSMSFIYTLVLSVSVPVTQLMPQKLWFENVIAAAKQKDVEAKDCAKGIFELINMIWGRVPVMGQTYYELTYGEPDASYSYGDLSDLRGFPMRVILTDTLADWTSKQLERERSSGEKLALKANKFVVWFNDHVVEISESFENKYKEILDHPRYGLFKNGYDSVLINLSVLKVAVLSSFAFYPDGGSLNDMRIQVNRKTLGNRLCQFMLNFRDFSFSNTQVIFGAMNHEQQSTLTTILEYVIVDAMHSIVCRKPKKNMANENVKRVEQKILNAPKREVHVRPFLRRLPEGYQASDDARDHAYTELGWHLPEGVTFVQSHERWIGLPAERPAPLFSYTDERFMDSILNGN